MSTGPRMSAEEMRAARDMRQSISTIKKSTDPRVVQQARERLEECRKALANFWKRRNQWLQRAENTDA